jgi:hypothetical protein
MAADAVGTSGTVPASLRRGVWFWRLRGRVGGVTGTTASPVWQFTVGARSAAVDTSWGTTLDVNGDGFADLAVGAPGAMSRTGRVYIYLGGAMGLAATPAATLTGPDGAGGGFGGAVASAGDVDGDGYADLLVGAPGATSGTGRVYVYRGGATGLAATPAATLIGPDGSGGSFGSAVASAGDVDGNGFADVAIGAPGAVANTGRAYVFLGGAAGVTAAPAATLTGPDGAGGYFGSAVASVGDVNADGYADVAVGGYGAMSSAGRVYAYFGSAAGIAAAPGATLTGPDGAGSEFGYSVASAGDVNGDGFADLVVGAESAMGAAGRVYLYLGSAAGLPATASTTLTGLDGANGVFGASVASAGDVNGDGFTDLAVGSYGAMNGTGRVYVYLGGAMGLATTPTTTLTGPDGMYGTFGASVASAGDVNGDGDADLGVGASGAMSRTGRAYVYLGGAAGLATTASTMLVGPDGTNGAFGTSVASAGDINGDGCPEVAVGAYAAASGAGRAHVYLGGAAGLVMTPLVRAESAGGNDSFGNAVAWVCPTHSAARLDRSPGRQTAVARPPPAAASAPRG